MTGTASRGAPRPGVSRAAAWLRSGRGGLFLLALMIGAGSGLGAVAFRYLISFFTWLATGHAEFGQQGRVPSGHLSWLGPAFFVLIPAIGGLLYGPLIYRFAREARGHGVPEVMIAVADNGGRIRPQVSVVKALASALCIGTGGSVGREGPIVQIGSAMASSLGQWVRMPENRLRILVACGAAGGISATFNAPVTGVFFGVEIILREFSVDALFTVMLSAMIADITAIPFLGDRPFLSGFPAGITLQHPRNYLLVALLAVLAALTGLAFKTVLYKTEDLCDRVWGSRPEWARPAVGGLVLGALLLAVPQLYGVGYPVMYKTTAGDYALWFVLLLAFGKIAATSLSIGIGGSGGVFAPSLFIGVTSGMAFGDAVHHLFGPAAGQPVLYAVVAMGAVFTSAAGAPLTSLASMVEMTGDFSLTLPVMLAVAVASTVSRALSYGTIYTTKLLRRGTDIDRATPWRALADLKVADAMHPFGVPLPAGGDGSSAGDFAADVASVAGPVTRQLDPQAVFAGESLGQALRQLEVYGRDGLPVISGDGQRIEGWVTNTSVLRALARQLSTARTETARAQLAADWGHEDLESALREPPAPLHGYRVAEITIAAGCPAAGQRLEDVAWPAGCTPVSVLRSARLRPAGPATVLRPGDRVSLLVSAPGRPAQTSDGTAPSAGSTTPAWSGSAAAAGPGPAPGGAGGPATAGREYRKPRGQRMAAKPVITVTATNPAGTGERDSNGRSHLSPPGDACRHEQLPVQEGVIVSASSWFTQAAAGLLRTRWLVRAPVWLYRARLGILLGPRFVMLEHTGRKSGARRHVVLEVVQHPAAGSHVVVSGFGDRAQWFRNIRAEPRVRVYALSRKPTAAIARVLPPAEAAAALADYAARHPRAWAAMEPVLRDTLGGGDPGSRLPVVALESGRAG